MPTQKRLWRHDQTASAWLRQDSCQRGKEGAIGWPQRRAPLLPCEHDELMAQDEQLDVFAEVAAPAADQQPQHGREGEVGERKQHSPILPSPQPEERAAAEEPSQRAGNRLRSPARFGIRARASNRKRRRYPPVALTELAFWNPSGLRQSPRRRATPTYLPGTNAKHGVVVGPRAGNLGAAGLLAVAVDLANRTIWVIDRPCRPEGKSGCQNPASGVRERFPGAQRPSREPGSPHGLSCGMATRSHPLCSVSVGSCLSRVRVASRLPFGQVPRLFVSPLRRTSDRFHELFDRVVFGYVVDEALLLHLFSVDVCRRRWRSAWCAVSLGRSRVLLRLLLRLASVRRGSRRRVALAGRTGSLLRRCWRSLRPRAVLCS
jgi:hypothetical protein